MSRVCPAVESREQMLGGEGVEKGAGSGALLARSPPAWPRAYP